MLKTRKRISFNHKAKLRCEFGLSQFDSFKQRKCQCQYNLLQVIFREYQLDQSSVLSILSLFVKHTKTKGEERNRNKEIKWMIRCQLNSI